MNMMIRIVLQVEVGWLYGDEGYGIKIEDQENKGRKG
jgi:hypothetical protein